MTVNQDYYDSRKKIYDEETRLVNLPVGALPSVIDNRSNLMETWQGWDAQRGVPFIDPTKSRPTT